MQYCIKLIYKHWKVDLMNLFDDGNCKCGINFESEYTRIVATVLIWNLRWCSSIRISIYYIISKRVHLVGRFSYQESMCCTSLSIRVRVCTWYCSCWYVGRLTNNMKQNVLQFLKWIKEIGNINGCVWWTNLIIIWVLL